MTSHADYLLATLLAFVLTFGPAIWASEHKTMDWLQKLVIVFCSLAAFGPYTAKAVGGWSGLNIYVGWFFGIVIYVIPVLILFRFLAVWKSRKGIARFPHG